MKRWSKAVLIAVAVVGVISIGAGAAFIGIGADKYFYLKSTMEEEQITLGINDSQLAKGEVVDTMNEAQIAGDIVRSHRHEIAPTYGDLLGGERYDPTDPQQLSYAQAMNIENYLYLAVASFGLTYLTVGIGAVLLVIGAVLVALAMVLNKWMKRVNAQAVQSAPVET